MEFDVVRGDIARQSADALVNAAGTSLAMGSGVAGFDLEDGARIIVQELADYAPESLRDVRFIAYGDDDYETVARVADDVRAEAS